MGKNVFMNLLFTHKGFPAVALNVIFWLFYKTMFLWQDGYKLYANSVKKILICCFGQIVFFSFL